MFEGDRWQQHEPVSHLSTNLVGMYHQNLHSHWVFFRIFTQSSNLRVIFQQGTGMCKVLTNKEIRWNSFRCSLRPIAQAIKGSSATFKGNIHWGKWSWSQPENCPLFFLQHGAMPHDPNWKSWEQIRNFLFQFLLRRFHRHFWHSYNLVSAHYRLLRSKTL